MGKRVVPARDDRQPFYWLATGTLLVVIMAKAQEVIVPVALSVVLAFALTPVVKLFERRVGRGLAVALVAVCTVGAVGGFAYLLKRQVVDLSTRVTTYSEQMRRKVASLRGTDDGLGKLTQTVENLVLELDQRVSEQREARPVKIVPAEATAIERAQAILEPVLKPLAKVVIVSVLVIFLLSRREDLRDRFIRLVGRRKITLTTRTLDEAGQRISRFLLTQTVINLGFGTAVTIGLLAIGIPYAPLWGFVTAVLRYVPFVGSVLAAMFPAVLAFAQYPGWGPLLATLALFLALDLLTAYLVEPVAIGRKTGVSSLSLLVMMVFWTWLWGAVGLLMATPLTVCLAVLGRQVPRLEFLAILLGDEPPLEKELNFYQRLLAGDEDEAGEILETQLRSQTVPQVLDQVIVPALLMAARDRARQEIPETDYDELLRTTRSLVHHVVDGAAAHRGGGGAVAGAPPMRILGVPARDDADELLLEILGRTLDQGRFQVTSLGTASLAAEVASAAEQDRPDIIVISSVPPGGLAQARYLCKRLRARSPETRIVVLRPVLPGDEAGSEVTLLLDDGTAPALSMAEARERFEQVALLERSALPRAAASAQ